MSAERAQSEPVSLREACTALWRATLSLMVAFMKTGAPAHRYLLARRIARNFDLLCRQDCFNADCRSTFGKLARRWETKADRLTPAEAARAAPHPLRTGWLR